MSKYQEMYFKLMGEIASITEKLIEVQQQMEEIFLNFEEK